MYLCIFLRSLNPLLLKNISDATFVFIIITIIMQRSWAGSRSGEHSPPFGNTHSSQVDAFGIMLMLIISIFCWCWSSFFTGSCLSGEKLSRRTMFRFFFARSEMKKIEMVLNFYWPLCFPPGWRGGQQDNPGFGQNIFETLGSLSWSLILNPWSLIVWWYIHEECASFCICLFLDLSGGQGAELPWQRGGCRGGVDDCKNYSWRWWWR